MRILTLLLLLVASLAQAQTLTQNQVAKLDSLSANLAASGRYLGTFALGHNGKVLYQKAIGMARMVGATAVAATPDDTYRIGSITKTFTATLILKLEEMGKLKTDDKLAKYFPKVANAKRISLAQMLWHRSGIRSFTDDSTYDTFSYAAQTHTQLAAKVAAYTAVFEPGARTEYSNSNYYLLGLIAERVSGQTYAQLLQTHIAGPAQLKSTFVLTPERNQSTASFKRVGNAWMPERETHSSIPGGAGFIASTAADLVAFHHALFSGKLLKAATLAKMRKPEGNMAMGLFTAPFNEKTLVGHTGGIDGYRSQLFTNPADGVTTALLCNGEDVGNNDIAIGLLSVYYNMPYRMPAFKTAGVKASVLKAYEGTYAKAGFPLKITIKEKEGSLEAQATGQSAFMLTAESETEYTFSPAGIRIVFVPATVPGRYILNLKQGKNDLLLERE